MHIFEFEISKKIQAMHLKPANQNFLFSYKNKNLAILLYTETPPLQTTSFTQGIKE